MRHPLPEVAEREEKGNSCRLRERTAPLNGDLYLLQSLCSVLVLLGGLS